MIGAWAVPLGAFPPRPQLIFNNPVPVAGWYLPSKRNTVHPWAPGQFAESIDITFVNVAKGELCAPVFASEPVGEM